MIGIVLVLSFLASLATAQVAALLGEPAQLQSTLPSLDTEGIQGCLVASSNTDGASVQLKDCSTVDVSFRTWTVVNGGPTKGTPPAGPIKIFGNKCLDVTNGANTDGTKLQIWTCDPNNANKNQLFNYGSDFSINWNGTEKCVDLTNGNIQNGNPIQIWDCAQGNLNQVWPGYVPPNLVFTEAFEIIFNASPTLCLVASSNANGAPVILDTCPGAGSTLNPASNTTWVLPALPLTGQISTFNNKCLDVTNGANADGIKLQIWTCSAGNGNQLWKTSATGVIEWGGKGKCVDLTNGKTTPGTAIQIWDCTGGVNQKWSYP